MDILPPRRDWKSRRHLYWEHVHRFVRHRRGLCGGYEKGHVHLDLDVGEPPASTSNDNAGIKIWTAQILHPHRTTIRPAAQACPWWKCWLPSVSAGLFLPPWGRWFFSADGATPRWPTMSIWTIRAAKRWIRCRRKFVK